MNTRRGGFTMMEVLIGGMVSAMLMSLGARQYSKAANQRAVANARDAVVLASARARSEAMRSGALVRLQVAPDSNVVLIRNAADSVLRRVDVSEDGVRMLGTAVSICYAARGYALPGCTSSSATVDVSFVRGGDTAAVVILPLGQVQKTR